MYTVLLFILVDVLYYINVRKRNVCALYHQSKNKHIIKDILYE